MRGFLVALLACLWGAPAFAAIGTPVALGTGATAANQATVTVALTLADCPIGSTLTVIALTNSNARTLTSVTDTASNTYGTPVNAAATSYTFGVVSSILTNDLPIGSTITATFSIANTNQKLITAQCASGITSSTLDISGTTNSGVGTTPLYPASGTVTPAQANELIYQAIVSTGPSTVSSNGTDGNGHSYSTLQNVASTAKIYVNYLIISSTAGISSSPTFSTSQTWATNLYSLKGGAPAVGTQRNILTLGVGQ